MPHHKPIRVAKLREDRPSGFTEPCGARRVYLECENEQAWERGGDNFQLNQRSSRAWVRSGVRPSVSARKDESLREGIPIVLTTLPRPISRNWQGRSPRNWGLVPGWHPQRQYRDDLIFATFRGDVAESPLSVKGS